MNIVIIDCFDTWEHRVELLRKAFVEDKHNVTVLMSDFRHIEKNRRIEKKDGYVFFSAEPYKKNISVARLHSHMQLSVDMFGWVERNAELIDLLWVLIPPNSFAADAGHFKQRHSRIKLIFDLIDLWPETLPIGMKKVLVIPWKILRDRNLQYADLIAVECNLYRKVLENNLKGKRVQTLYLSREDMGYQPNLQLPNDRIDLVYLGSINNIIDIDAIEKILIECQKVRPVKLFIIGDGEKKNRLIMMAKAAGVEVEDRGIIYNREEKQRIFDSCHYGLNIMKKSVRVGLTMKSLDYFEFGLPIINNIHGDTWDIVEKYGCGYNYSVTEGIPYISGYVQNNKKQRRAARDFFEHNLSYTLFRDKVRSIVNFCV